MKSIDREMASAVFVSDPPKSVSGAAQVGLARMARPLHPLHTMWPVWGFDSGYLFSSELHVERSYCTVEV